jgi:hypothetical protein
LNAAFKSQTTTRKSQTAPAANPPLPATLRSCHLLTCEVNGKPYHLSLKTPRIIRFCLRAVNKNLRLTPELTRAEQAAFYLICKDDDERNAIEASG